MSKHCHVCIGCGRCADEKREVHVLTEPGEGIGAGPGNTMTAEGQSHNEYLIIADIGTTTIAMQLYDKSGEVADAFARVNPQTEYGADVLSRILAAENPADARRLQEQVREVLVQGITRFRTQIAEEPVRMVVAANTTMVYFFMGWDAAELGKAPFRVSHLEPVETMLEGIPCYILPALSAFVGGDIVAGILAGGMCDREEITLLIDLGTNGELVLGNRNRMLACSTAAGPAFEGGVNRGVWGSDMISILAGLKREGIVDETGLLADPYFEEGVRCGDVCVTQEAIRAIQLAKGAIRAGIQTLVQEYGISPEQIDKVVLAGGFGYYLNAVDAVAIGLLPKELEDKTETGGNTALAGALQVGRNIDLMNKAGWQNFFQKQRQYIDIINLADIKTFRELYISSMDLK